MGVTWTYDRVASGLLNLANGRPDYVYVDPDGVKAGPSDVGMGGARCRYFDDSMSERRGAPSCIVGHLLAEDGVTLSDIWEDNRSSVGGLLANGTIQAEDELTESILMAAQDGQDRGLPWAAAVNETLARFPKEN